jgi:hypothetical protein
MGYSASVRAGRRETHNLWNDSFRNKLLAIPVGESKVFFYIGCGSRKGTATRVDERHVLWLIPDTGDSNAMVLTIDECVEKYGYHQSTGVTESAAN